MLHDVCHQCLLWGNQSVGVNMMPRWLIECAADYGLSMRKANREYKVHKAIMAKRLVIGWCDSARVWAMCFEVHGYEPEMESWGQSPCCS